MPLSVSSLFLYILPFPGMIFVLLSFSELAVQVHSNWAMVYFSRIRKYDINR